MLRGTLPLGSFNKILPGTGHVLKDLDESVALNGVNIGWAVNIINIYKLS